MGNHTSVDDRSGDGGSGGKQRERTEKNERKEQEIPHSNQATQTKLFRSSTDGPDVGHPSIHQVRSFNGCACGVSAGAETARSVSDRPAGVVDLQVFSIIF